MNDFNLGDLFTGQLVRLSAAKTPDLREAMARWSHDAEYMRQLNFGGVYPDLVIDYEREEQEESAEDKSCRFDFAIRSLADDRLIGECGLWVGWTQQNAWLGIGVGEPEYRGKGYGTDAMRLLVGYGFRELGLYRITLGVFGYNLRAIRSYEKVGFVREQIHRASIFRDGQRHDFYTMGLLRSDWESTHNKDASK